MEWNAIRQSHIGHLSTGSCKLCIEYRKEGRVETDIDYDALGEYQSLDVLELLQPCQDLRHRSAESLLLHGTHANNHLLGIIARIVYNFIIYIYIIYIAYYLLFIVSHSYLLSNRLLRLYFHGLHDEVECHLLDVVFVVLGADVIVETKPVMKKTHQTLSLYKSHNPYNS